MSEPAKKPDKALASLALDVKTGVRTYDSLDDKKQAEVRTFLKDTSFRTLRTMAEDRRRAGRQPAHQTTHAKISNIRTV